MKSQLFCSGSDAILLSAETLRGLYPVETMSTVGRICAEVNFLLEVYVLLINTGLFGRAFVDRFPFVVQIRLQY